MMKLLLSGVVISTLAFGTTGTLAAAGPAKTMQTPSGMILVNTRGMPLYIYEKDTADKSNCNGPCATAWPPLMVRGNPKPTGNWSIVVRDDGTKMWALSGHPLYLFASDKQAGQVTGDGVEGFHVAKTQ